MMWPLTLTSTRMDGPQHDGGRGTGGGRVMGNPSAAIPPALVLGDAWTSRDGLDQ